MLPLSLTMQKAMIPVAGKPILSHIVDYWSQVCEEFVFVVHHRKDDIIRYVGTLDVPSRVVEIDALRGIADGLQQASGVVDDRFVVVLGDCLCRGTFSRPFGSTLGVGVLQNADLPDIRRSYSVELMPGDPSRICRVVEKPTEFPNRLCGMGYYSFDRRVFDYIRATPPSALRNEIEITDTIQRMIDGGEEVGALLFDGHYMNVTYPEDLEAAEAWLG
jgi:NDP-sugar pyrophosphorylase family protein